MQSYCDGNADYFAAVRLPWVTYPADGRLDCAVFIADKWWAWALQLVTLSLLALGWYKSLLAPFKVRRHCAPRVDCLPVGGRLLQRRAVKLTVASLVLCAVCATALIAGGHVGAADLLGNLQLHVGE
jgi:hypothetical protein